MTTQPSARSSRQFRLLPVASIRVASRKAPRRPSPQMPHRFARAALTHKNAFVRSRGGPRHTPPGTFASPAMVRPGKSRHHAIQTGELRTTSRINSDKEMVTLNRFYIFVSNIISIRIISLHSIPFSIILSL